MKQEAFFIIFKGLSVAKNCFRPKSLSLTGIKCKWKYIATSLANFDILNQKTSRYFSTALIEIKKLLLLINC